VSGKASDTKASNDLCPLLQRQAHPSTLVPSILEEAGDQGPAGDVIREAAGRAAEPCCNLSQ
jgi:hypothetical protein